jgi:hypothetical protein
LLESGAAENCLAMGARGAGGVTVLSLPAEGAPRARRPPTLSEFGR